MKNYNLSVNYSSINSDYEHEDFDVDITFYVIDDVVHYVSHDTFSNDVCASEVVNYIDTNEFHEMASEMEWERYNSGRVTRFND